MAIISMTGFGSAHSTNSNIEIEISVKTVNARFLEIKPHLPREYYSFESDIKNILKIYFRRGTVDVFIQRRRNSQDLSKRLIVHHSLVRDYLKHFSELKKKYKIDGELRLEDLIKINGIFTIEDNEAEVDNEKTKVLKILRMAATKAAHTREREGRSLKIELKRLLQKLHHTADEISKMVTASQITRGKNLAQRLDELSLQTLDSARVAQEISIQLERSDTQEEIVRLQTHLNYCLELLDSKEASGKSLDFYSQELLREINTIGSKVASAAISKHVVSAKTVIDQFKEQVLNIE